MTPTLATIEQALALSEFDAEAAQGKMAPLIRARSRPPELSGKPRLGGVLVLLYRRRAQLHLVLTKRRDDLPSHAGQISFPGGKNEEPESLLATALRETEEEIGIAALNLTVLGALTPIYIPPSDYEVHPFVALYNEHQGPRFKAAPREVAQIIEAPLSALLDPHARVEELWNLGSQQVTVPYFALGEHKVWGATAIMLSEFIERVRAALDQ
jgi:8-oxo-dGTP pyrophosphatase MutT (NUDIX family)